MPQTSPLADESGLDDAALVKSVAENRDRVAFASLFERWAPKIKNCMERRGVTPELSEAISAESMIRVWRNADSFNPAQTQAATWIFVIVRDVFIALRDRDRDLPFSIPAIARPSTNPIGAPERRSDAHVPQGAPHDLFITDALDTRPAIKPDYRRESLAIQALAARMAHDPDEVLAKLVDLALDITGGASGGLSLYEPAPGVFRWHFLRGALSEFNGATTPRDFSPCGITLDRNCPLLTLHPERVYTWLSEADVVLPEVLLVPLYIGGAEPLGTLWVVSEAEGHFTREHARVLAELAAFVGIALLMRQAEQRIALALAEQMTLTQEMSHRVRNVFAITDGMIRLSARDAADKDEMAKSLSGRLQALASAHSLVSCEPHQDRGKLSSDIATLLQTVAAPYAALSAGASTRIRVDGPEVPCGDHAITGLALIFYELATNSVKFGALTSERGAVDVCWHRAGEALLLSWTETGGPPIQAPSRYSGFGASLVRKTIAGQFAGTLAQDWRPEGLRVEISLPLERLAI